MNKKFGSMEELLILLWQVGNEIRSGPGRRYVKLPDVKKKGCEEERHGISSRILSLSFKNCQTF